MAKRTAADETYLEPRRVRPRGPTSVHMHGPRPPSVAPPFLPRGTAGAPAVWRSVVPLDRQQQAQAEFDEATQTVHIMHACVYASL